MQSGQAEATAVATLAQAGLVVVLAVASGPPVLVGRAGRLLLGRGSAAARAPLRSVRARSSGPRAPPPTAARAAQLGPLLRVGVPRARRRRRHVQAASRARVARAHLGAATSPVGELARTGRRRFRRRDGRSRGAAAAAQICARRGPSIWQD